jgi:cytochrome c-type biogenesis protein CcmE
MKARHRRALLIAAGVASVALVCAFVLNAFRANVMFFVGPSELLSDRGAHASRLRLGGMVVRGSLTRDANTNTVRFVVADQSASVPVIFSGPLPDLFREGSGVVAQGTLGPDGRFHADEVLARHDEKYSPPQMRHMPTTTLREAGR